MATAKNNDAVAAPATPSFADLLKSATKLSGHDLLDKAELVGVPFIITEVMFKVNEKSQSVAYVTGVNGENKFFEFNDFSGTGVRQQLIEYVHETTGQPVSMESGEIHSLALYAPNGLRRSDFEVDTRPNKAVGKPIMKAVSTYYISKGSL
jgi:hypothetical protein